MASVRLSVYAVCQSVCHTASLVPRCSPCCISVAAGNYLCLHAVCVAECLKHSARFCRFSFHPICSGQENTGMQRLHSLDFLSLSLYHCWHCKYVSSLVPVLVAGLLQGCYLHIILIIIIILSTTIVRIPGVKSKNVKNFKAGWNDYVSLSSSSVKVSRNKIALKCCTSTLTVWKRNGPLMVHLNGLKFCGPVLPEKKPCCHSVWLNCHWLKLMSRWQFSVFWAFPVSSLFSDCSCCMSYFKPLVGVLKGG